MGNHKFHGILIPFEMIRKHVSKSTFLQSMSQNQAASSSIKQPTSSHNFPGPGLQNGGSDGHIDIEGAKELVQSPNLAWTKSGVAVCCSK
jgi:hypothetical protein